MITYPIPADTFESMVFLFPVGGVCVVSWRVSKNIMTLQQLLACPSSSQHLQPAKQLQAGEAETWDDMRHPHGPASNQIFFHVQLLLDDSEIH